MYWSNCLEELFFTPYPHSVFMPPLFLFIRPVSSSFFLVPWIWKRYLWGASASHGHIDDQGKWGLLPSPSLYPGISCTAFFSVYILVYHVLQPFSDIRIMYGYNRRLEIRPKFHMEKDIDFLCTPSFPLYSKFLFSLRGSISFRMNEQYLYLFVFI